MSATEFDFIVIGTGAAALTAALTASVAGLKTAIIEKTDKIGGTSAMSGAASWLPVNHYGKAAGYDDTPEEALDYLRATAPEGWRETEDALWESFARNAGPMLAFVEAHTPLRYALTSEPDVYSEAPGAKTHGRMVAPMPLSRRLLGPYAKRLRASTLPHIFTYQEMIDNDLYRKPIRTTLKFAPQLLRRLIGSERAKGAALTIGLMRGCLDHGCHLALDTRAIELTTDPAHGGVTGVVVEHNGQRETLNATRGVLLATGGFEWDRERLQQHFPGPIDRLGSSPGNAGDALRMAEQVGAALAHMDQALIYPCLPTRYDGKLHAMPAPIHMEPNAIVVDRHGKRFVSEYAIDLGEALDRRGADGEPEHLPAWLISDRTFLRPALRWYAHYDPDWLIRAPTVAALADRINVPREALTETITRFNSFCAKGRDEDFHRGESIFQKAKAKKRPMLSPIQKAPYVAMPFNRCILTTKGGLRTNEHAQVLREDGSVITGLYCAGAAMANPIGTRAISAGTTIGPNMTWGYICAQNVLRTNRPTAS
ncbi:MAG: FAD-dependent oxidoreductase [Rhizobiales bacterium]|nr:FAD-dependent oxidoreductase [Hyphomicrobiales bacterium]